MESSVDLPVTSEIDMIAGACANVQAGERGWHVGVSQVTHVHMQCEVVSRTDSHWTPLQKSCRAAGPCSLITHTHKCMHTQVKHTPNNYAAIHM